MPQQREKRSPPDLIDGFSARRRHLPHWDEPGRTYFITFGLRDRRTCDLTRDDLASLIISALRHFNGERYRLYDYTVMPDHVHAIIQPIPTDGECEPLFRIMHSLKSWTANRLNERLGRRGALWEQETYDHLIRNESDYEEKSRYIWLNPVARGLTRDPAK